MKKLTYPTTNNKTRIRFSNKPFLVFIINFSLRRSLRVISILDFDHYLHEEDHVYERLPTDYISQAFPFRFKSWYDVQYITWDQIVVEEEGGNYVVLHKITEKLPV